MPLDIDRIRQLAEDEAADLPPISAAQAEETVRLLSIGTPKRLLSRAV
jgi:hypothetical protein